MEIIESKPLDTSDSRYWRQNAQQAVRDVFDALIELITNSDDRYVLIGVKTGKIEIEVERKRGNEPSILRVRDFADGMTLSDMGEKIYKVGGRVSGLKEGKSVRGTNSRGAKDVAILGGVTFESIAKDGNYHRCEISPFGEFISYNTHSVSLNEARKLTGIKASTGTVVSIKVDANVASIPHHDNLRKDLGNIVSLRDIIGSPDRKVILIDKKNKVSHVIKTPVIEGKERLKETFEIPGYKNVLAKLIIKRAKDRLDIDNPKKKFRKGGILIKSRRAIHEATLFASDIEKDPFAKWFYGKLTCEYIDDLWNEYDERYANKTEPTRENPRQIFDPLRKEGLAKEHPFVSALFKEALIRLRPLVEEERKQAEKKKTKIESDQTRKRLNALEKAASKFMREHLESGEEYKEGGSSRVDSTFNKKGFSLNPSFAQVVIGHSIKYWLMINQELFPELSPGEMVEIVCASDEVSCRKFDILEKHPNREGTLRSVWSVKGEKVTKATGIKVRVGDLTEDSVIEVIGSDRDRYSHINQFCFHRKRYTVQVEGKKTVKIFAPYPSLVSKATQFDLHSSNERIKISGNPILKPKPDFGIAECKLKITSSEEDAISVIRATIPNHECQAEVETISNLGSPIKIELDSGDMGNQRHRWSRNILLVAANHPSLKRYLGPPPKYSGQEDNHFRVLLAEIVADAVVSKIIEDDEKENPEVYEDFNDWNYYYAEYTRLMTEFLPVAHDTQVNI